MRIKVLTNVKFGNGDDDFIASGTVLSFEEVPDHIDLEDARLYQILEGEEKSTQAKPASKDKKLLKIKRDN